jgi:hypothetical protein
MWRFIFIAFLIAHGLIHLAMWVFVPKPAPGKEAPFDASHSWLLGNQRVLAATVAVATMVLLVAAGIGLWAHADWWRAVAVAGLGVSFGLMVVWFNPWFAFIEIVNAGLLVGIAFYAWPSVEALGA